MQFGRCCFGRCCFGRCCFGCCLGCAGDGDGAFVRDWRQFGLLMQVLLWGAVWGGDED